MTISLVGLGVAPSAPGWLPLSDPRRSWARWPHDPGGELGAILVTGYLGGAAASQVRVGDPWFLLVW